VDRQPGVLEHLLIRGFAAATITAVAAAALAVAGLVAFVAGSVEADGYLTGRTTIGLTELPFGPDKDEHIEMLSTLARDNDVTLTLLVPDRSGARNTIDAFALTGSVSEPVFWGTVIERSADAVGDAVILWTYGVDGSADNVTGFLDDLVVNGFAYMDETPSPLVVGRALLDKPGLPVIVEMVILALMIAFVAESERRAQRQRVRRLVGWSRREIVGQEFADIACLVVGTFVMVSGAFAALLAVRGASPAMWAFCAARTVILAPVVIVVIVGSHVGFSLISGRRAFRPDVARWRPIVVGAVGLGLAVILTSSTMALATQRQTTVALERSLAAEAASGDDVTLGIGIADENQDLALGQVALRAFAHGTASMAMTNALPDAVVVIGETPGVPAAAGRFDGVTVLVPTTLADEGEMILREVRQSFADGWAVDDDSPPRAPNIRALLVESTRPTVESIDRWVDWAFGRSSNWPEIPVVVVSDARDMAPNRIGTATHNGEVRFADRAALLHELRAADLMDVVTQVNRTGTTIERQLAEVREDQMMAFVAMFGAGVVAVFAAGMLAADHHIRSRRASRLRSLVGRHPIVDHLPFVVVAASACAATTTETVALVGSATGSTLLLVALGTGLAAAVLLSLFCALPSNSGRTTR
jgi:hypothetical protein